MTNIVIPMAGLGSRFKNIGIDTPKPLIKVNGKTLIEHSVETLGIDGKFIFITRDYEDSHYNDSLTAVFNKMNIDYVEVRVNDQQLGAAHSCLYASDFIDNYEPLVITNCDQSLSWDAKAFLNNIDESVDGCIVTYSSEDPKNSYARVINGAVVEVAEKKVISNDALVGIHYWKHGKDFISSAKELVKDFKSHGLPECYVSVTYNYMIKDGKKVTIWEIPKSNYHSLGTPEDVVIYESKIKEFYTDKPQTIFCDIDGTILKHVHGFSYLYDNDPISLPGVVRKFNEWDSKGHKIILTTARKESAREMTEEHLKRLGLCWDQLIMGCTSGKRVLINDKLRVEDPDRAESVNLMTDGGFDVIDWTRYRL